MKTKVTKTSIANHHKNVKTGAYIKPRVQIVAALKRKRKALSRTEISIMTGLPINVVCGRVNEMLDSVLKVIGVKKCSISGKNVEAVFLA